MIAPGAIDGGLEIRAVVVSAKAGDTPAVQLWRIIDLKRTGETELIRLDTDRAKSAGSERKPGNVCQQSDGDKLRHGNAVGRNIQNDTGPVGGGQVDAAALG